MIKGSCGLLKLEWDYLLLLSDLGPCLGAYLPSVFHFPSIECGRSGSHNISFLFPRCRWTPILEFFCSHPCWLTWMTPSTHRAISYFWAFVCVAIPTSISSEKAFIHPLRHNPGLFLQDAHSLLAHCMMHFIKKVVVSVFTISIEGTGARDSIWGIFAFLMPGPEKAFKECWFEKLHLG